MITNFNAEAMRAFQPEVKLEPEDMQYLLSGEFVLVKTSTYRHDANRLTQRLGAGEQFVLVYTDMDGERVSTTYGDKADLLAGRKPRPHVTPFMNVRRPNEPERYNWTIYQKEVSAIWVSKATAKLIADRKAELWRLATGTAQGQGQEKAKALAEIREAEENLKQAQEKIDAARQRLNAI